jgi:hypothetical protein
MSMSRFGYKKEYVDNFDEIKRLYESGVSLLQIHEKLTKEGKLTVPVRRFQNLHSTIKEDAIPLLRKVYAQKTHHVMDFEKARERILELLQEGMTYEQIYATLCKAGNITMSYRFFRKLSVDHGLYRPAVLGAPNALESDFLKRKEEIVKSMAAGKFAKTVFNEMHQAGFLKMAFSTFRTYCLKHGVEMRLMNKKRNQEK